MVGIIGEGSQDSFTPRVVTHPMFPLPRYGESQDGRLTEDGEMSKERREKSLTTVSGIRDPAKEH